MKVAGKVGSLLLFAAFCVVVLGGFVAGITGPTPVDTDGFTAETGR